MIPVAYADYLDLENKKLVGYIEDLDAKIVLQFGENNEQKLYSKTKITPVLQYGIIKIFDDVYTLDNTSVKILGESFRVVAFEETYNILIYVENLGDDSFDARVYIYNEDTNRSKFTFNAVLTQS